MLNAVTDPVAYRGIFEDHAVHQGRRFRAVFGSYGTLGDLSPSQTVIVSCTR